MYFFVTVVLTFFTKAIGESNEKTSLTFLFVLTSYSMFGPAMTLFWNHVHKYNQKPWNSIKTGT